MDKFKRMCHNYAIKQVIPQEKYVRNRTQISLLRGFQMEYYTCFQICGAMDQQDTVNASCNKFSLNNQVVVVSSGLSKGR